MKTKEGTYDNVSY